MSATDGYVASTTKVVDHGPDNARWNLVIVGDGYQASELTEYHDDVQRVITQLQAEPPLNELFCGINVYRIDVVSTDSGVDDPAECGGTGAAPATYFDATYCSLGPGDALLERLLTINSALALDVASAAVPLRHQVLAIVNSPKSGGAGGAVAVCSRVSLPDRIAIHELGHSAFGLADEYGGDGTGTPAGEPTEPNVTRDTNRATNKWRALIDPATPMPSRCDPGCEASTCVPPPVSPPIGAVGTYEGGMYSHCNIYRPLPGCLMRGPASTFCPVCAGVIRQTLQPFLPAESINLLTPSIAFTDVPAGMGGIGVTTHRAIVFEVVTCRVLTFEIINGPTGGFGTPFDTLIYVTADPILPAMYGRLWLSYTSTNPGDSASGSVTVRCAETMQIWTINIVANTIARPRSAVALILDRSGSMKEDAGDAIPKVQKLREAAEIFISVMQPGDGLGLVNFNDNATRLMEVQDVGAESGGMGRTTAVNLIRGPDLDPQGHTSIGDGVVSGKQMLDDAQAVAAPPYDVLAQVVLTDGKWNRPPKLSSVSGSITANTFAVGLGLPSNISVQALTTLCQGHNGFMLVTGLLTADQSMRLSKYFLQILAGITNAQIATDPRGVLGANAEHRIPFQICEADYGMDCILLCPYPWVVDFQLEAPDGTRITPVSGQPGANSKFVMTRYASYYRCAFPVLPANVDGSHGGLWHAALKISEVSPTGAPTGPQGYPGHYVSGNAVLPYELIAQTYSGLSFAAFLTQASYDIGAIAHLDAVLKEYDVPLRQKAHVWVEIRRPDGVMDMVLFDEEARGHFLADYSLNMPGVFVMRVRARGETTRGTAFERERTLTAVAVPGGDRWSPDEPETNEVCELLQCIRDPAVMSAELTGRLRAVGIDVPEFLKCVEEQCRSIADELEVRRPQKPGGVPGLQAGGVSLERLVDMVVMRVEERLRGSQGR